MVIRWDSFAVSCDGSECLDGDSDKCDEIETLNNVGCHRTRKCKNDYEDPLLI